jgi:hypothetical protein
VLNEARDTTFYKNLAIAALIQCNTLQDRFCIFDVEDPGADVAQFRTDIGLNYLKYGAAYTPALETTLTYQYEEKDVAITEEGAQTQPTKKKYTATAGILNVAYESTEVPSLEVLVPGTGSAGVEVTATAAKVTIKLTGTTAPAWKASKLLDYLTANPVTGLTVTLVSGKTGDDAVTAYTAAPMTAAPVTTTAGTTLASIKETRTDVYNMIRLELNKFRVTLPPSPAVAGVYAAVDRDRGVWKAPANVSINAVVGPTAKISSKEQEALNVDPNTGKSINAIRTFAGKGTLIWGARTLAGNDNQWRYVPVRRLFNMIEESSKKATAFALFEPNDATTWLKVKGMLESFLYGLWQQGALAGSKPEQAYFVHVGLGKTMTPQDILEGRMNVEIGIAAVRPAEFIILKFSHKLQES